MKTLTDFSEYREAAEKLRDIEEQLRQCESRKAAIQSACDSSSPATRVSFSPTWRHEYETVERQEPALREQIEAARRELASIRGQISFQICQQSRPVFVAQIKRNLAALKDIEAANAGW